MRELTQEERAVLADPQRAVCFTGPRASKLPGGGDKKAAAIVEIERRLERAVTGAAEQGGTVFLNGCMAGLDVLAGETVLRLKRDYPGIWCVTVAPFRLGFFATPYWTPEWRARALALYRQSDIAFSLSETYHKRVYYERNEYLINHAGAVICYYAGTGGGTKYTLNYAKKRGLAITNIAEN